MKRKNKKDQKRRIIAGISGGPDSMALAEMLRLKMLFTEGKDEQAEAENEPSELIFCHVNYHHRPTADRDEQIVRDYAFRHQIPLYILHANPGLARGNFQAWAREVRYQFFEEIAREQKASVLAIAHQQDDLIETWLMQKQRKIIPDFFGLPEYSSRKDLTVWRPLLCFSKEALKNWCSDHQIVFGIDESNLTDEYLRNRIRHQDVETMDEKRRSEILNEIEHQNRILKEKKEAALALSEDDRFLEEPDEEIRNLAFSERLYQKTQIRFSSRALTEAFRQLQESSRFAFSLPDDQNRENSEICFEKRKTGPSDPAAGRSEETLIREYDLKRNSHDSGRYRRPDDASVKERSSQSDHRTVLVGSIDPAPGFSEDGSSEKPAGKILRLQISEQNRALKTEIPENTNRTETEEMDQVKKETRKPFLIIESPEALSTLCQRRQSLKLSEDWGVTWTDTPRRIESFAVAPSDFPLRLDHVRKGDAIELRYGTKKISRILIDQKIERSARQTFPLLRNNHGKVIFMPLTGCDVSHFEENSSSGMVLFSLTNSEQNQKDSFEK